MMTRKPQPCRYCGHVATDHARDGKGGAAASAPRYSCKDVRACGDRIRGGRPLVALEPGDCPF